MTVLQKRAAAFISDRVGGFINIPLDTTNKQGVVYQIGGAGSFSNPAQALITTSMSSLQGAQYVVTNLTDRGASSDPAHTTNVDGSWMQFDLGSRRLDLSHVMIQQRNDYNGYFWDRVGVFGSLDETEWVQVGSLTSTVKTQGAWNTITTSQGFPLRYIRLQMAGTETAGTRYFCVQEAELFGLLYE